MRRQKNRIRKDNEKRNDLENKLAKETNANKRKSLQKRIERIAQRIKAAEKERQSYARSIRDWQPKIRQADRKVAKLEREKRRTKCK